MNTMIRFSDVALESMVLAASEAHEFGNNNGNKPVETYAHVWGYRRPDADEKTEHIFVDRFNACVSAEGSYNGVEYGTKVVDLQDSIVRYWSPHMSLLGEFHTHPFKSVGKLRKRRGWEFSKEDDKSFLRNKRLWKGAVKAPITIVMAIAPLNGADKRGGRRKAANRWRFDVGEFRFDLAVAVGRTNERGKRYVTGEGLTLDLDRRFQDDGECLD